MSARYALDGTFAQVKALIIERTGHFYYIDKDELLWDRVHKRLRATGNRDCGAYLDRLRDPVLGPLEWTRLEAEITIGETFFFRYAEQFTALRQVILPDLIARNADRRRLRIWSAGCATGAEAYSVAILLRELLGESLADWRVGVVGTDINDTFLATAREARFGEWALRALSPEQKTAYFLPTPERTQWQLRPEYRSLVRFERHNLLSLLDGTSPLQFTDFDLILCRNVLIYFHPDTVDRVVRSLRDTLCEGAWMLLGHAEPNPAFSDMMRTINLPGTTAYRRLPVANASHDPAQSLARVWIPPAPLAIPPLTTRPSTRAPVRTAVSQPAATPAPFVASSDPKTILSQVRRLADAGDLEGARTACANGLAVHPVCPLLHFYGALVAQALMRPAEAEKSFRQSLYLDKNFVMAHYHLGLHLIACGKPQQGQRSIANALRIAATLPPESRLAEADGVTAGEFRMLSRPSQVVPLHRSAR